MELTACEQNLLARAGACNTLVKSHLGKVSNQLTANVFTVQQFLYVGLAGLGPEQRAALRDRQDPHQKQLWKNIIIITTTFTSTTTYRFGGIWAALRAAAQRACQTAPPLHPNGRVLITGTVRALDGGPGQRAGHGG